MVCIPNKTFQINWHYSVHFSGENKSFSAHGYVEYMNKTLADRTPGWSISVNDHICLQYLNFYYFLGHNIVLSVTFCISPKYKIFE